MMKLQTDFDQLTQSTRRREFEDGLLDFTMAGIFLVSGLIGWLLFSEWGMRFYLIALIQNREMTILGLVLLLSLLAFLILGARRLIEKFRRNIIWRDSGFVKSLRWQVSRRYSLLAVAVVIAMVLGSFALMLRGLVSQEAVLRALVSSAGAATGIIYFGLGTDLSIQRYKWVGSIGGLGSTLILFLPSSFSISWLMLGITWLVILSISGIYALRHALGNLEGVESG